MIEYREEWLTEIAKQIEPFFKGFELAPYRLTCGWPCKNALSGRRRRVGECHALESSAGKLHEIFISPFLFKNLDVAGTVCHELAHIAAGLKAGHGKGFKVVCQHVGLTKGRLTSAMPGPRLEDLLAKLVLKQGDYPHHALLGHTQKKGKKTVVSLNCGCGCKITMSIKWYEEVGAPTCGCGEQFNIKNEEDE